MTPRQYGLSKSKISLFEQCPKRLWLSVHRPELAEESDRVRASFTAGHEVGDLACRLHTDGIMVDTDRGLTGAIERTAELLASGWDHPIFEATFRPTSYGFRPGRSCRDALREVDGLIREGYCHVVDADLKSYFDSIPHERLMERVSAKISDGRVLALLQGWLEQDIVAELERWTPTEGTPQGAVISPLLANIYLDPLDEHMAKLGHRMVRYADDFVVLCKDREEAEAALSAVRRWVAENGLSLHPDKTHVGDCRVPGQGFEFLGYRFEAGRRFVRKKSWDKLKDGIRAKTGRSRGVSLARVIADLNPILRGWFGYFKQAHYRTFDIVDGFVRRRLRAFLRKQQKRPGHGISLADHQRWTNAYFANAGLFALHAAWQSARQSR